MRISRAGAVDVLCILLFAVVGRSSHNEGTTVLGVADTAWPFLAGCAAGLLAATVLRSRPSGAALDDPAGLRTGVLVWACTVGGGMLLRLASGDTAQPAFVIVATLTLAVLLLGWRAGYKAIQQSRQRTAAQNLGLTARRTGSR